MTFNPSQFVCAAKRLTSAEGYLELRMPRQALESLDGIGDPGPLRPIVEMLRGKALWLDRRYEDAARSLRFAARNIHSPHNRPAWLALSIYYRNHGQPGEALDSLARARGASLPERRPEARPF
ncbi:MAG: hypothetical protein JW888_04155 [Pirellulales bacterium]|nr:hypothetical protein [Pirellulales bacterium]